MMLTEGEREDGQCEMRASRPRPSLLEAAAA